MPYTEDMVETGDEADNEDVTELGLQLKERIELVLERAGNQSVERGDTNVMSLNLGDKGTVYRMERRQPGASKEILFVDEGGNSAYSRGVATPEIIKSLRDSLTDTEGQK